MRELFVRGMRGLGDGIFMRAFLRSLGPLFLETPWPELFDDLPDIRPVRADTALRTQARNVATSACRWHPAPRGAREILVRYGAADLAQRSIPATFRQLFRVEHPVFDLPPFTPAPLEPPAKLAIIRPATVRKEWLNVARNPDPVYLAQAAAILLDLGYFVISIADLVPNVEDAVLPLPPASYQFHRGELSVRQMLGMVRTARVVVGGVGWLAPAAFAYGTPFYCVLGGHGGHNAPEKITDPAMDLSRVGWATPRPFCRCADMRHRCAKTIPGFEDQFRRWLDGQRLS